jgi:hypothetical protein
MKHASSDRARKPLSGSWGGGSVQALNFPRSRSTGDAAPLSSSIGSRPNLVIVRAGRGSLHPGWVEGNSEAEFDLLIATYEDGIPTVERNQCATILVPGPKIAGYYEIFRQHPELLERYEAIALFDDDISTTKQDIGRLFSIGQKYRLDLFQPALSWDSYVSYGATLANAKFRLRYTNVVEMMCPVFSTKHLKRVLPLFGLGYETGIDLLWTRVTDTPWFRYAIVDDVVVKHTRPVGTTKTQQGFGQNERYDQQVQIVLKRFGARFRGIVTYAAIDRSGLPVLSRRAIGIHSLAIWAAWRKTPMHKKDFARLATDCTRHCLTRPINLHRIPLENEARPPLPNAMQMPANGSGDRAGRFRGEQ